MTLALLLAGAACTDDPAEVSWTVRDSAGVEIVESTRPMHSGEGAWRIGPEPLLRIGVLEGDPAYEFSGVTGAVRLPEGRVVVADNASLEVRFFDAEGRWVGTVGRRGGGPGEFAGAVSLGLSPDGSVWAYDFISRRITFMDASATMTGYATLEPEPPMLFPVGFMDDGSFLLKQLWGVRATAEATEAGFHRDPLAYVRFDRTGALVDSLGLFPGREILLTQEDGRGVMTTPSFARNSVATVRQGRASIGSQTTYEIQEYDVGGRLIRSVRLPGADLSLDRGAYEAHIEERVAREDPARRAGLRATLSSVPLPDTRPAYGALMSDQTGNLWVSEWALFPDVAETWTVFDDRGRWVTDVRLPPRFSPTDIGDDWILGVQFDGLDVERVVVYPIVR